MRIKTKEDTEAFKEMGKTFWRLVHESETLPNMTAQEAYVRKKMESIYSKLELDEFYSNLTFIGEQSDNLHQ